MPGTVNFNKTVCQYLLQLVHNNRLRIHLSTVCMVFFGRKEKYTGTGKKEYQLITAGKNFFMKEWLFVAYKYLFEKRLPYSAFQSDKAV